MFRPIINEHILKEASCSLVFLWLIIILAVSPLNSECVEKQKSEAPATKEIKLKFNLEEQKKLQAAVDNGHQPWRLDPIDVAVASLRDIEKKIDHSDCRVDSETKSVVRVKCKGSKQYAVLLKRMVKPNGIWTMDIHLLSLALKLSCPIWSNDKDFDDVSVKIYSTVALIRQC